MGNLFIDLEAAKSAELVEEVWDAADVQRRLAGMDDRLTDAFTMKQQRLEALVG